MARKSVLKRIRVTKTGKLMRRRMAQAHFRANKANRSIRNKRVPLRVNQADYKKIAQYLK